MPCKSILVPLAIAVSLAGACAGEGERCGPSSAIVARVIDGDTIELDSGERVRYLMIDAPESTSEVECYGQEASDYNRELVEGKEISLVYDIECTDRYDRLLAYVSVDDREINSLLVERGYACTLHIPPNGADRQTEFAGLERIADQEDRGLWGVCEDSPC